MNHTMHHNQKQTARTDHNKHVGHDPATFLRKFWISALLSIPIILYSDLPAVLFNWTAPAFIGSSYLPAILGSFVFFYGGWIFLKGAWHELQMRMPGMMTLIALAITTAYSYSIFLIITGQEGGLFWEIATLISVMLIGHWMEMRAVSGAQQALKELSKLIPDTARVLRNGTENIVPLADVRVGDIVLVKPGERIPTDGTVRDGQSDVNESIVTGESRPVTKQVNDTVIAGTINGDGALHIVVTQIGEQTFLAGVMRLVAEAQQSKSRLQQLSDRAAAYLTYIAITGGIITLVVWIIAADTSFAVTRMVAVLVIACPHALGLAIPLVASIATTKAARNGFLVKQRLALEMARTIDIVLFDKTGTLTKGEFGVDTILSLPNHTEEETLRLAASVNALSEHPLAQALVAEAKKQDITLAEAKNFKRLPGIGVEATIEKSTLRIGSAALVQNRTLPRDIQENITTLTKQGKTINLVMRNNELIGVIALADTIREESRKAIRTLHAMGIETAMITGDSEDVAQWVAGELGITTYFANIKPDQKSEKVKALQAQGKKVAMVGDGVNDAPALTQADLGVAIGAGTNVAIESAGIILVRNNPQDIPKIIHLSRLTYTKMIQNLFWATGYNVIALPLAGGALASFGIFLQPAVGALFMSLSTVIVAINALALRGKKI